MERREREGELQRTVDRETRRSRARRSEKVETNEELPFPPPEPSFDPGPGSWFSLRLGGEKEGKKDRGEDREKE